MSPVFSGMLHTKSVEQFKRYDKFKNTKSVQGWQKRDLDLEIAGLIITGSIQLKRGDSWLSSSAKIM